MRSAARSQHSVHYVSTTSVPGHKVRMVSDIGSGVGIQRITVTIGHQTGAASVIVSGRTAYLQGNTFTMRDYFSFTKAQATKYSGRWISIPHSDTAYATVSADATFESFVARLFLFPHAKLSLVTVGNLVGVRGSAALHGATVYETILAPAHGKPLPVREKVTSPDHPGSGVTTIRRWNEAVQVHAPANAVPIATVRRS